MYSVYPYIIYNTTHTRKHPKSHIFTNNNKNLLRNLWPKPIDVLEHRSEGETNRWFPIILGVFFWRIPKTTKDVNVRHFIHCSNSCKLYHRIPVNYTIEFL